MIKILVFKLKIQCFLDSDAELGWDCDANPFAAYLEELHDGFTLAVRLVMRPCSRPSSVFASSSAIDLWSCSFFNCNSLSLSGVASLLEDSKIMLTSFADTWAFIASTAWISLTFGKSLHLRSDAWNSLQIVEFFGWMVLIVLLVWHSSHRPLLICYYSSHKLHCTRSM